VLIKFFIIWFASASYSGYIPRISGTAGTAVGILVYSLFSLTPPFLYLISTITLLFLGWWAAEMAETIFKEKDSPKITIDEVTGFLVTMFFLPQRFSTIIAGFLFFRIFDIIKPIPAKMIDRRMKGGLGVVLDDVVAGVYANLLLQGLLYFYPNLFLSMDQWFFHLGKEIL
jgi:phosphatidylglycerophosphatase A